MKHLHWAVALVSVSLIAFQIVLMQLLSVMQWYHYAYMVISVAMLGFGASGTLLAIARTRIMAHYERLLPILMFGCAGTMAMVVMLSQTVFGPFDTYLLFTDPRHIGLLAFTYLCFFTPFFLGALAIAMVFYREVVNIGSLYFANLFGSGLGGILVIVLLWQLLPERLPALIAFLPLAAGFLMLPRKRSRTEHIIAAGAALVCVFFLFQPPELERSQYKDISEAMNLPDAEIVHRENSPYGVLEVVRSESQRYAPGLSLHYTEDVPVRDVMFNDGNWFGVLLAQVSGREEYVLDYATNALPYEIRDPDEVLVLQAGSGSDMAHALSRGAEHVTGVEPHRASNAFLRREGAVLNDSLFFRSDVDLASMQSRTYLFADRNQYDLIVLPTLETFGGTAGVQAMQEQYHLTRQAFEQMWHRLSDDGMISITSWMDYPVRHPLKALATITEMLEQVDAGDPEKHIAAIRGWGTVTFVVSRSEISASDAERIREFGEQKAFDPLLLPGITGEERTRFNRMEDEAFFDYVDTILSGDRERFYSEYDFNIRPATDDQPYFSRFLQWQSIPNLTEIFGERSIPYFELGYLMLLVTLVQIVLAALLLILLPLLHIRWKGGGRGWTLLYFGGLGTGFMFLEIVLIQKLILYLGQPVYATAAVLSIMLICSGIGSYHSSRFRAIPGNMARFLGTIVVLIILYTIILTPILYFTIGLPVSIKALLAFILVAPPAFLLGVPFPLGLRYLSHNYEEQIPWAWGIDASLSVVSTALAMLVAVHFGFVAVSLIAALAYGVSAVSSFYLARV